VRYGHLIAQREARREAERQAVALPDEPAWLVALNALHEMRGDLLAAELRRTLTERANGGEGPEPDAMRDPEQGHAEFLAHLETLVATPDDEVCERLLALQPTWEPHFGWPSPAMVLAGVIDEFDDPWPSDPQASDEATRFAGSFLDEAAEPERPMIDVTPDPPEPIVTSIDLWQPWDRRRSPFD
jgi:hypothetical protein